MPSGGADDAEGPSPGALSHRQIQAVLVGLMVGLFIAAIDQTIVSTALPRIVSELGGVDQLSWVVVAYLLTSTAVTPLWGKVGDLYGRRRVFQAAIVVFVAGSLLCGLAPSMLALVLARGVQGLGGGGLFALSFAIVGDIISPRQRGRYMGYFMAVFASAGVIGPLAGGFITDSIGWRWIFTINVPIGAVALVVTSSALRLPFPRRQARLDLVGAALLVAGVTCLVLVSVWGGGRYAWLSGTVLGTSAAGLAILAAFVWWETRVSEPIVPLRLFGNPVARIAFATSFLLGPLMYGVSSFLPLFLQGVNGFSATDSGLLLAPNMAGLTVASVVTGRLMTRSGRYKRFVVAGATLLAVDLLLLGLVLDADTGTSAVVVLMVLVGMGMGLCMPVLSIATQNALELRDLGVGTSTLNFCRSLGGSLGVAGMGAVLAARLSAGLDDIAAGNPLPPGVDAENLANKPSTIQELVDPLQGLVEAVLADAVATAFLVMVPFSILAAVLTLRLRELPLRDAAGIGAQGPAEPAPTEGAVPSAAH